MWPLPSSSHRFITVNFSPQHLWCCWFEQLKDKKRYCLKAYQVTALDNSELEHLIIFNPSRINSIINTFLENTKLKNPFALFCLNGSSIFEQFIPVKNATPQPEEFSISRRSKLIWDYIYLYSMDNGQSIFYVAGITRDLLFQYHLVALHSNLNLVTVTSRTMALLTVYKESKGLQFRHSQLGIDLVKYNNHVDQMIDEAFLTTLVSVDQNLSCSMNNEAQFLLPALGLFLMRNDSNA